MTLRPADTHGGESAGELSTIGWPKDKKTKKKLLEYLGFMWDKYNALHIPDSQFKTQIGANVRCHICNKLITLKNIGAMSSMHGIVTFACKDILCDIRYSYRVLDMVNEVKVE
jgi:hypothetical protein